MEGITSTATAAPVDATMAKSDPAVTLMSLPLEVRYKIFDYAAVRGMKPKKLLRYWFEKKEVKELVAQQIANNPAVVPRPVYSNDANEHDSDDQEDEEPEDEDMDDDEEHEDEEEDEEGDDNDDNDDDDGLLELGDDETGESAGQLNAEAGDGQSGQIHFEEDQTNADQDVHEGTATAPPPPPQPVVRAHRKWRYIPNFMRITHCPPPPELFLVSSQLNREAKSWFYDVAVLRIDATGSFAHTSFFEEAFTQITDAAFSPMENIRKVEVTFVWDTTWIRADDTGVVQAIFPAMLRQRSEFVVRILLQAPDLKEVVIHWHDSAQDNDSAVLMLDVVEGFYNLPADVKVEEHYIAPDEEPSSRSVAGQQRVEFQRILDSGLDRMLF